MLEEKVKYNIDYDYLKKFLKMKGLTYKSVDVILGLTQGTTGQRICKKIPWKGKDINSFCECMNLNPHILLGEDDELKRAYYTINASLDIYNSQSLYNLAVAIVEELRRREEQYDSRDLEL